MKLLLAKEWTPKVDPTGWYMTEKLDGVRAYWNGTGFISRLGHTFSAPDWFLKGMPLCHLDGELWLGRGRFQDTVSAVRKKTPVDEEWARMKYWVFDAPEAPGGYPERLQGIPYTQENKHSCRSLDWVRCSGAEHLLNELRAIEAVGGEGIMLRKPGSLYERKRSSTLLKVKTFHDAEATVTGHEPGEGKHTGRLGAVVCDYQGTEFKIGTGFTDAQREAPPAIGSLVTFSYQELTRDGVPRFPVFLRLKVDE